MLRWLRQLLCIVATLGVCAPADAEEPPLVLGIFYEGCEHTCEGFRDGIARSDLDAVVKIHEINQDKSRLPGLVQEARTSGADLVLTFGTSVTLGIVGTLDDDDNVRYLTDIPVIFTLVADPFGTRIAERFEASGRKNVTGTFNRVPEAVNVEIIRQYDPTFDTLGLLYNSNEPNSLAKLNELREVAPTLGIELVALEIDPGADDTPDPAEIPLRMAELRERGVEWVYLGSSSFLRVNGAIFTASAVENGIAVVSPYESLVREQQALLSIAAQRYDVGLLAADQAVKILRDGVSPGDLPIVRAMEFAYVVNMDVAKTLDRFPPISFLQVAETVSSSGR